MSWVAVAIAGGAVVGGIASMSAADKQADAANKASDMSLAQYQQTRSDLAPWMNAGKTGLSSLMNLSGQSQGPLSVPQALTNAPITGAGPAQPAAVGPAPNPSQFMKSTLKDNAPAWFAGAGQKAPKGFVNRATGEWGPGTDAATIAKYSNTAFDQKGYDAAVQKYQQQQQVATQQAQQQQAAQQQAQQQAAQQQAQQQQPAPQQQPQAPQATPTQQQATEQALNPAVPASAQLAGATQNAPLLAPFSLKDFQESPAYQFNLQQGMDAINKSAASRGQYYAPQTLQDLGKYTQGMASNEFGNAYNMYNNNQSNVWNRLFALQGTGQNAAAQTGAFGANATNMAGNAQIGAGNAQAAGIVGVANAATGAAGDFYNQWMTNQILNSRNQSIYNSQYAP